MSAPRLPNLNSFRREGIRGRGRGRGGQIGSHPKTKDEIIQSTDNDAATSRLSAVDAGYLDDPFAKLLSNVDAQRRLPLMNRGTYIRTIAIDRIVDVFTSCHNSRRQIISLGAGSDTRYFRLKSKRKAIDMVYHEIDFASNSATKISQLKSKSSDIMTLCGLDVNKGQNANGHFQCSDYHIHSRDLRTLQTDTVIPGLEDVPTLLISECCLIYLAPDEADDVLAYFSKAITAPLAVTIYEPIRPHDSFGQTMVRNLIARGIHLQTLEKYAELADQRHRLMAIGLESRADDTECIWRMWTTEKEKERVDSLEWLDEMEEFVLLARHYCVSWGWRGLSDDAAFKQLAVTETQH